MKFIIIAVCIIAVVAAGSLDQWRANFEQVLRECKEEVGARDVDIDNYNRRIPPESHEGKCMIACLNIKHNIQDENGKIDHNKAKNAAREMTKSLVHVNDDVHDKLLKIYLTCVDEDLDGPDACEVAKQWFICVSKGLRLVNLTNILTDTKL